jgi:hypothetical protein
MVHCLLFLHYKHSVTMHRTFAAWALILYSFSSVHAVCMFSSHLTMKPVTWNITCICGLLSCLEQMHQGSFFLQRGASMNCTTTHPTDAMYFAEVLQMNILYSTENISFSHTCLHVHTPNKKHFFHTHACTCVYAGTHLPCPATCFHYWSPSWLAPNIDRWHRCWHSYLYCMGSKVRIIIGCAGVQKSCTSYHPLGT